MGFFVVHMATPYKIRFMQAGEEELAVGESLSSVTRQGLEWLLIVDVNLFQAVFETSWALWLIPCETWFEYQSPLVMALMGDQ